MRVLTATGLLAGGFALAAPATPSGAASNVVKGTASTPTTSYLDLTTTGLFQTVGIGTDTTNSQCEVAALNTAFSLYLGPGTNTGSPLDGSPNPGIQYVYQGFDGNFQPLPNSNPCTVVQTASTTATTYDKLTTPGSIVMTFQGASSNAVTGITTYTVQTDTVTHPNGATVAAPSTTKTNVVDTPGATSDTLTLSPVKVSVTKPLFDPNGFTVTTAGTANSAADPAMSYWHQQPNLNLNPTASKGDKLTVTVSGVTSGQTVSFNNVQAVTTVAKFTDLGLGTIFSPAQTALGFANGKCKLIVGGGTIPASQAIPAGKTILSCFSWTIIPFSVYNRNANGNANDPAGLFGGLGGSVPQTVLSVTD